MLSYNTSWCIPVFSAGFSKNLGLAHGGHIIKSFIPGTIRKVELAMLQHYFDIILNGEPGRDCVCPIATRNMEEGVEHLSIDIKRQLAA